MKKTIAVTEKIHAEVKTLCKTLDLELGAFVEHSMLYFKKTGINPSKSVNESPLKAIEEQNKRLGQVVAFFKEHEQKKLNPLHEQLMILTNTLADSLKILPKSERFEKVIRTSEGNMTILIKHHKDQMGFLRQSQQKINDENKQEITDLTKALKSLQTEQKDMNATIDAKLSKKMFG